MLLFTDFLRTSLQALASQRECEALAQAALGGGGDRIPGGVQKTWRYGTE